MKKIVALCLTVIMGVAALAGCGGSKPAETTKAPEPATMKQIETTEATTPADDTVEYYEELRIVQDNINYIAMDPFNKAMTVSCMMYPMVYNTLVSIKDGEILPELATEWETDDYQHFTFKLRDDVKFHNGEKFTADDVAFMIDKAKEEMSGTQACQLWSSIESYEVVSDTEIKLDCGKTNVDLLKTMANYYAFIMNRKAYESGEGGDQIGTGAYKIADFVPSDHTDLVINEDYWGEPAITKKITILGIAETTAKMIALENAEVDMVIDLGVADAANLAANDKFEVFDYTGNATVYVAFNCTDALMSDINFRMAVLSLINREDHIAVVRNGYGAFPTSESFWGPYQEFQEKIELTPYDVEAAKNYLAESSYNGETVKIIAGNPPMLASAQLIQQEMVQIGINAEVESTDNAGLAAATAWGSNTSQIVIYGGVYTASAASIKQYLYPNSATNKANYTNDEVTKILDEAPNVIDAAEREAMYKRLQEIVYETRPYTTIYHTNRIVGYYKGIGGAQFNSDNCHDMTYVYRIKD